MYKNGLIGKIRIISNFMTWQTGKQSIAIHMLKKQRKSDNKIWSVGQNLLLILRILNNWYIAVVVNQTVTS